MSKPGSVGVQTDGLAEILVEQSPNGILVTDPDGRIRVVNPAVRQMIPLVHDPVGRVPEEVIPIPQIARALNPDVQEDDEFAVRHGNHDLLVRAVGLRPGRGRLVIVQDISRFVQEERTRAEFVANVSHELRTPTTSIVGYSESLLDEPLDEEHRSMVEVIHRNALRLTALFEDLLALSRLEAESHEMQMGLVEVDGVISEVVDKWRPAADEKRITLQAVIPPGMKVRGNVKAMVHLVGNLVENAVKYSHEDGLVTIRSWTRDERICVEVIDVGIGIAPTHHRQIFGRFYRVDKGRSRAAGGTGLGLALVKSLADAMDAEIEVRSRKGRGSVFRVWFPMISDSHP